MTPFMFGAGSKNSEVHIDEKLRGIGADGRGEAAIGFETQLPLVRAQEETSMTASVLASKVEMEQQN